MIAKNLKKLLVWKLIYYMLFILLIFFILLMYMFVVAYIKYFCIIDCNKGLLGNIARGVPIISSLTSAALSHT